MQGGTEPENDFIIHFFCGNGNGDHHSGTG
jgi:hypothetical protein